MLTIIGGLLSPTTGTVTINNENLADINEKERSKIRLREIGFILQASNLVPFLTVANQLKLLDRVKKGNMKKSQLEELYEDLGIGDLRNDMQQICPVESANALQLQKHYIVILP